MCRWAQFRQALDEIEVNVKNMCSGSLTVNYRQAIGGGYYISVTSGFLRGHKEVSRPLRWSRGEANSSENCTTSSRMEPDVQARG